MNRIVTLNVISVLLCGYSNAAPRDSLPLDAPEWPRNYRLHLDGAAKVKLTDGLALSLDGKTNHDVAVEHPADAAPVLRVWSDGRLVRGPEDLPELAETGAKNFPDADLDLGADFTAMATFETNGTGTLFSKCAPEGKWSPGAKALFIRDGRLVYDIGWLGAINGGPKVNDGKAHTVVLSVSSGTARLWLDGKSIAEKANFTKSDEKEHVFKVGCAAPNFAGDFTDGKISVVKLWKRALPNGELALLFKNGGAGANTPDFTHTPKASGKPVVEGTGWVQALERSDHAEIVSGWNAKTLEEGATIYKTLCVVCHGTKEQPGSLPTALRFAEGQFKNGRDPFSMYLTLTKGFGQMVPQPQYTTAQKYAVIHYIRETFLRPHNPSELKDADITSLPRGLARVEVEKVDTTLPPYQRMELGNALFWTMEVAAGNIAQKGIAIRLDDGPGGVTKGRAWMVYDHDTMRVAAASTGGFVDWKGIAFDGSHGTHTSLIGEKHFINPSAPGWGIGEDGFADTRMVAKDGKKYGPVVGLRFLGLYKHQNQTVIAASIHGTTVLESPAWLDYGTTPVFVRTINMSESKQSLWLRVAPASLNVVLHGAGRLTKDDDFWFAKLESGAKSRLFISRVDPASLDTMARTITAPIDLAPLTHGGPAQWPQTVTTTSVAGNEDAAFIADDFPLPLENPFQSWMRPGGFDFTPDGKAAIVAMWNGDIWRVDGVMDKAPATLIWRRIASGLHQPLGVKFRGDELFITCRDQIAKLVDLNADGETDFIQCFNDDAEVTEHFHEFAMGLQTDSAGNFYYAKSGRHALDSVVPQHGTLLKVSADGSSTEILATGFRAAIGVCLNDDGTFFVTDQEGFWTPKNRINRVKPGGFYGNMFGYTSVTDTGDSAMEQPMVWITNEKDRSPAELIWVPKNAWGNLGGSLLNLSYGTGRAFIIPHEEVNGQWQGAVCELPMPAFATGIMRGRFGPDGALYTCGMFAWAGNATNPGGFHRIRPTGKPARVPLAVKAMRGTMSVTFCDPITDTRSTIKVWSLKRTKNYGSKHHDEHELPIRSVKLSDDKRTLTLDIPDLAPTHCYELKIGDRVLHGTIHQLANP